MNYYYYDHSTCIAILITFTTTVIITTDLFTNTNKSTLEKDNILEKLEYFQFLATDQRQELQYWQYAEDLETKTPLCWAQISILTRTLVPSLLWHFLHQFFSISFYFQWQ